MQVLRLADENGWTAGNIADSAEQFKADGGVGIEAFLDQEISELTPADDPTDYSDSGPGTRRAAVAAVLGEFVRIVDEHEGRGVVNLLNTLAQV